MPDKTTRCSQPWLKVWSLTEEQKKEELIMRIGVKKFNSNILSLIAFFTNSNKRLKTREDREADLLNMHLRL